MPSTSGPEATLTAYSKLMLHPVEVQFAKNWDPASGGSALYEMHEPDREKIKSELAEVFAEVFKRDLEKGGYPLVNEAGRRRARAARRDRESLHHRTRRLDANERPHKGLHGGSRRNDADHCSCTIRSPGQLLARAFDQARREPERYVGRGRLPSPTQRKPNESSRPGPPHCARRSTPHARLV